MDLQFANCGAENRGRVSPYFMAVLDGGSQGDDVDTRQWAARGLLQRLFETVPPTAGPLHYRMQMQLTATLSDSRQKLSSVSIACCCHPSRSLLTDVVSAGKQSFSSPPFCPAPFAIPGVAAVDGPVR